MKILRVRHLLRLPTSRVLQHGASGTAPVAQIGLPAGADAFVSLCRCESVWSRRHFSGTVVYSAVYRSDLADFLQKLRLFNSHQVLQLRENASVHRGRPRRYPEQSGRGGDTACGYVQCLPGRICDREKKLWSSLESVSFKEPLHW